MAAIAEPVERGAAGLPIGSIVGVPVRETAGGAGSGDAAPPDAQDEPRHESPPTPEE